MTAEEMRLERLKKAREWSRRTGVDLADILEAWARVPLGVPFHCVAAKEPLTREILLALIAKLDEGERARRAALH